MDGLTALVDIPTEFRYAPGMGEQSGIPRFYLYGEAHKAVDARFVHVERLDDRSRPSEWTIRPHAHAELNHIFHVRTGGGSIRAEHRRLTFDAPCLLVVPAGVVHGFSWDSESVGSVITVATSYLHYIRQCDPALEAVFGAAEVYALGERETDVFNGATCDLMAELSWGAPAHRAAIEAGLLKLLVLTVRAARVSVPLLHHVPGHQISLAARLRERIESRFRLREPVIAYAGALGTSLTRLRAACAAVAGQSPIQMLDRRTMLEAERAILYSELSISEIARSLGFDDPHYFSRFFRRHSGQSPRSYRLAKKAGLSDEAVASGLAD